MDMRKIALLDRAITRQREQVADSAAFAEAYQNHIYAVFNYCLFRVNDRNVAEDLTADAFERAWQARHRYNPDRATFSTWVFTIARRVIIDWQRRQTRHCFVRLTDQYLSGMPSLETHFEETEAQNRLRQLVRNLEAHEQELIALKFGAGLNNREIAQIIEKSETAIGSSIHRVMKKLRTQWEALG
jgi:RNA polymerase sigma-70 factor (ECF subfamily)